MANENRQSDRPISAASQNFRKLQISKPLTEFLEGKEEDDTPLLKILANLKRLELLEIVL